MGVVGTWFVEGFLKFDKLMDMYILVAMELNKNSLFLYVNSGLDDDSNV